MKFFLSLLIVAFSFGASASAVESLATSASLQSTMETNFDGGKKKNKRINKKRKRKCAQFGRRVYAG